jgi:hypothetical protein
VPRPKKKLILLPDNVVATIETLQHRIRERFGERGLTRVCGQLFEIAKLDMRRATAIARRYVFLRLLVLVVLGLGAMALLLMLSLIDFSKITTDLSSLLQGTEAAFNLIAVTGTIVYSLLTLEQRLKRGRALAALHELRSIVHVIDMHQLTKDPSKFIIGSNTPSSPPVELNEFQMTRYLEYCTEMLSLASKVAVMFGQALDDPAVAEVVSDIEHVSTGLSQKIGQKILILQQLREADISAAALSAGGDKTASS